MRASPTEFVIWNVATRAKSAAKLLTKSSICSFAEAGHVVVFFFDARVELRDGVADVGAASAFSSCFHFADERGVLFEQLAVFGADELFDFLEVILQVVEDAAESLLVLHAAVELGEHLVGVVDRRERLVGAGVRHTSPGVGAIGDHDAEFERAEASAGGRICLQEVLDFLVDGDAFGPAGRRVGAALDVAGEQFGAGEQAADAAHVVVAVAADLVGNAVEDERAVFGTGSSGLRLFLSVNLSPCSSGQNAFG